MVMILHPYNVMKLDNLPAESSRISVNLTTSMKYIDQDNLEL